MLSFTQYLTENCDCPACSMDHKQDGRAVEELKAALLSHKKEINAVKNDADKVYDIINRLMTAIAKSHDISGQKMHDMWVDKYKEIPDTWIMEAADGLWANIHAKQKRIKNGSGEKMRKPGSKGAPTAAAFKASQESVEYSENLKGAQKKLDKNHNGVLDGQDFAILRSKKTKKEQVEENFDLIEDFIEELALINNVDPEQIWESIEDVSDEELLEAAVDAKGYKSSTGGLTQKGRDHYNSQSGGNLKAPVTTSPSKLKAGSKAANRRKSFCARMGGMEGPMKKPNGEPTRKALALRKWNC